MRAYLSFTKICLIATAVGASLMSCTDIDCHGGVACTGPGDAGVADSNTDPQQDSGPIIPEGCDPTADAKDAPKCVDDILGVFVDATSGSDSNPGTKEAPTKTIGAALGKLEGKPRVYICGEGPYAENVHITSAISIFGGFECTSWRHDGSKAKISPNEPGYALHVNNISSPIIVADLDITAKDAVTPGASSIAVFASRASTLTLRRTNIVAGKGQSGADASNIAPFNPAKAPNGTSGEDGGAQTPNPACSSSIGGAGGNNTTPDGKPGLPPITPVYPDDATGTGGTTGGNCTPGIGIDGSYGIAGATGIGAATLGTLDADGWKASDGASGGTGGNGQGGGGGAQRFAEGVGGSGGPGGCGGAGGSGGGGGGASIALLAFESPVFLEESSLSTSDAGNGGNGAKGQKAQLGGSKGIVADASACDGGFGGHGGSGGGGGGGAGGVSIGVLFKGTPPTIDGVSTPSTDTLPSVSLGSAGIAGSKGLGGEAASPVIPASNPGVDGSNGTAGVAKAVLATP